MKEKGTMGMQRNTSTPHRTTRARRSRVVRCDVSPLRPTLLALLLAACPGSVWARDYFDPALLSLIGGGQSVDLSQYESRGAVPEGEYLVDVYLNKTNVATQKIRFAKNPQGNIVPQITPAMLKQYGVDLSRLSLTKGAEDKPIEDLSAFIPAAGSQFSLSQLRLDLSIPQMYVASTVGGYVDPALWDQGVPVMLFNYNVNASKNWQDGINQGSGSQTQNLFASTNGGLNAGPWRLRSTFSLSDSQSDGQQNKSSSRASQFSNTYLQRNVAALRSELTMGEVSSGGGVFDSIPFRGVKLESDDAMQPSGQRGFAPVVNGVAQSNALVTITQNGNVIYQTNVPPGPFRIDDLYQAGTAGDLVVTVTESDGSKHISTQAYSSLPMMLRPGNYQYEMSVGRYQNGGYTSDSQKPAFALGTLVYGLPHYVTLYGGILGANNYQSLAMGTGISLGVVGALSFDATMSKASIPGEQGDARGASYRMKYSKSMLATGSTVDLTSYRYSTSRYYSFSDVNSMGYSLRDDAGPWNNGRKRSSWQVSLSQSLSELGSVYLRGTRDDYWGVGGVQNTLSAGFSSNVKGINYSLNYSIDRRAGQGDWPINRQIAFNMSVPLSLFTSARGAQSVYLNYNLNHSNNDGHTTQQVSGGGSLTDNLSYSLSQGWGNKGDGQSGSLGLSYSGAKGSSSAGYNYGRHSRGVNAGLSGGMLVHQHGVIFSQTMGDSMALVSVPDVEGVKVSPGGMATNSGGYALVPYMTNYQKNVVSLDPTSLPNNAEVMQNSANLYPTRGAVVLAKFKARIGQQVLMTLLFNGQPVPFGAMAGLVGDSDNSSIVGDAGAVYLSGLPPQGRLHVQWGTEADRQCAVAFTLPPVQADPQTATGDFIQQMTATCR
ncbi:fimbria/pilus outer membrane usher protein [Serratia quinivorans]|uniref:fimbria/pilus outer membrane usher protein n=1 Tax=Serratia quinivorans TaxID=137545 RepID=UPI002E798F70|nr:fimbria/pilus outer membrane usher protein [Serratia quinivorans]